LDLEEKMLNMASMSKNTSLVKRRIENLMALLSLSETNSDICPFHNIFTKYGLVSPRLYKVTDKKRVKEAFKLMVQEEMKSAYRKT
jgi:hypothetical protein